MRSWKVSTAGVLVLAFAYASLSGSTRLAGATPGVTCQAFTQTTTRVAARSTNTLTHLEAVHLAPGERDGSTSFDKPVATLRAGVFSDNRAVDEQLAAQVLAAVETQQGVELSPAGAVSRAEPFRVSHPGIGDDEKDSYYSVFAGYRTWLGTFAVLGRCTDTEPWTVASEGSWSSFEPDRQTGTALCSLGLHQYRSSYVKGSLAFRACSRSWW